MQPRKMVGSRFKRNARFLSKLSAIRTKGERIKLINQANPNQIFAIMDAANNILNETYNISSKQKTRLLPHRDHIRLLGRARTYTNARRILQTGGGSFLPALLAPIIIELAPYVVKKIYNAFKKK